MEGAEIMPGISSAHQQYLKRQKHRHYLIRITQFSLFFLFLIFWETAARLGWIDAFIFSSPGRVAHTAADMAVDKSLFLHSGVTLLETLISFFLTIIIGLSVSVILWYFRSAAQILEPYLVILNSLPKSALAPLLIVWLGANIRTIIVSGISVAVFGMILNLYTGFQETDPEKIKLIYTLRGNRKDVLFRIILPGTVPLFVSILKVNIGLCLVGVIIGEFIGSRMGLGYLIIYGSQTFQLNLVITSIVILCGISLLLYLILGAAEKRYLSGTRTLPVRRKSSHI